MNGILPNFGMRVAQGELTGEIQWQIAKPSFQKQSCISGGSRRTCLAIATNSEMHVERGVSGVRVEWKRVVQREVVRKLLLSSLPKVRR